MLQYAKRMDNLKASEIRELLKLTEQQDMISFGGGLPAPELFPLAEIKRVSQMVLDESGAEALQYTTTEGYLPLRRWVAERINKMTNKNYDEDNVILTNGSQQALDLSGKLFLDEGDVVLCESPTYLAAINAFRAYNCQFAEVDTDEQGMIPESIEALLQTLTNAKLIYVIPDFQNPTGRSWSLQRRQALMDIASQYSVAVIEDNPYGELRFEGVDLPCVKTFDQTGQVILLGTFSKIFCPGYRIGWIVAEKEIISKYALVKQGADLQCNTLAQREIAKYLELYCIDDHIQKIKKTYLKRRDLAIATMERSFPKGVEFTRPQGGLFLWVTLPKEWNAREILKKSLEQGVAFVPGGSFFPNGGFENTMRINFSYMSEEKLAAGLEILGKVLSEELSHS